MFTRKAFLVCFSIALLFVGLLNVSAQERVIEKFDYDKIIKDGKSLLHGKIYREKRMFEEFEDRGLSPTFLFQSTSEFLPPDRRRIVHNISKNGKTIETREGISIGSKSWLKVNRGRWEKIKGDPGNFTGTEKAIACRVAEEYTLYKITGEADVFGEKATVYEREAKREMHCLHEHLRHERRIERYWISVEGKILKALEETETIGTKKLKSVTTIYEYDPKIKIEAPIK